MLHVCQAKNNFISHHLKVYPLFLLVLITPRQLLLNLWFLIYRRQEKIHKVFWARKRRPWGRPTLEFSKRHLNIIYLRGPWLTAITRSGLPTTKTTVFKYPRRRLRYVKKECPSMYHEKAKNKIQDPILHQHFGHTQWQIILQSELW